MNKKIVPIILVFLSCLLFTIAIILVLNTNHFSLNNKVDKNDNQQVQNEKEELIDKEESNNEQVTDKETNSNQNENITVNQNNNIENNTSNETNTDVEENNSTNESENTSSISEDDLINYFALEDSSITSDIDQDDRTLREKAKNAFVSIVDFIFYDKEIKGYTFNELTTTAKLKVIEIALSIDNKIDEYFPDYKDVIKTNYTNIKGKLAVKYLEFTSYLCEKVGEDTCTQAKEDFKTMKESFGFTWQLIKELAKTGSEKIKTFYESWRDS